MNKHLCEMRHILLALLSLIYSPIFSQQSEQERTAIDSTAVETEAQGSDNEQQEDYNDTWRSPIITDDMTVDPGQNKAWRTGEYKYSAKPKNSWELGIGIGHFHINGDVPADLPSGYGLSLHLRKAINYALSWRIEGHYNKSKGLDGRLTPKAVLDLDNFEIDQGEDITRFLPVSGTYRNFSTRNYSGAASLIFNIGNILFHSERNKWNLYLGVGLAVTATNVKMDYYQGENTPYNWDGIEANFGANTKEKRDAIRNILDGEYESEFENERNVPGFIHDSGEFFPSFLATFGLSRKLSKRINLSFEHQTFVQDYDNWDGHEYRTTFDQSNNADIGHYTNIRFGINLANFDKKTEPLYWLNPLDAGYNDIANLKAAPKLDISDDDGDGVINMIDIEINSDPNCPVDTRGVMIDSDGDGLIDCKDVEPFSPPGCPIDEVGVAQCDVDLSDFCDECDTEIQQMIRETLINGFTGEFGEDGQGGRDGVDGSSGSFSQLIRTGCGEWFLPMIHFDNDEYTIKPEFYGHLHHVADVMKRCPELCVVAQGFTDSNHTNAYNNVLSYNRTNEAIEWLASQYGLDRSRFKIMYGGEESPLIPGATTSAQKYMNRRVEFRLCEAGDYDMAKPEGEAGSSRTNFFNGNKNSGY